MDWNVVQSIHLCIQKVYSTMVMAYDVIIDLFLIVIYNDSEVLYDK
jgi:hypothetical protein